MNFFSVFSGFKLIHWIFLGVAGVGALAAGGYAGYWTNNNLEEGRIAVIDANNRAETKADQVQISALSNNLAVCHDTLDKQDKAITAQNKATDDLRTVAAAASKRAQDAIAEADAHKREAQQLSAALAARKPDNGTYKDLVALIQEPIQ